jgi:MFS family permease
VVTLNLGFLTQNLTISSRNFAAATLLSSGTLAWFFILNSNIINILSSFVPDVFWVYIGQVLFYGFGVFSAIVGSLISGKVSRHKFLLSWITLGIISTVSLALFQGILFCIVATTLLGLSLGLGLPSSLAFLADCTTVEERGRTSGITILGTFIMAFLSMMIASILHSEILAIIMLCTAVRSTSLLALILQKCDRKQDKEQHLSSKPDYKELSYYLIPWVMFIIAGSLASMFWIPETETFQSAIATGNVIRYALIALFGLVWGITADRFGRKKPIIIGLVVYGISFALLGFGGMSPTGVLFYTAMSGISWGAFFTIYLVIPGDFSISGSRERVYALGTISPFIIFFSMSILETTQPPIFSSSAFSQILSIILFISIIPVLLAKETLLESKRRERRMKEHVERVGRVVQESKKPE